jgi:hypothetical protein
MMEAVSSSETAANFYQTTYCNVFIPAAMRTSNLTL